MPLQARRHLLRAVYNAGYLFSMAVLPDRVWFYRFLKRVQRVFDPSAEFARAVDPRPPTMTVEGFPHSANGFLAAAFRRREVVSSHQHRLWAIRQSLRAGLPTVVVLRAPLETVSARIYRSRRSDPSGVKIPYPAVWLAAWLLYYRYVGKRRRLLYVVDFAKLVDDYDGTRARLRALGLTSMSAEPPMGDTNPAPGPREAIHLSWIGRMLLRRANALYRELTDDTGPRPMPETPCSGRRAPGI